MRTAHYFWENAIAPQLRVTHFSLNHCLILRSVFRQFLFGNAFNPIYWEYACLIVNSGSLEDNSEEEVVDIYDQKDKICLKV